MAIILSLAARFSGYILVGIFLLTQEYQHWPMPQCPTLTAVGLFFVPPRIFGEVLSALTGARTSSLFEAHEAVEHAFATRSWEIDLQLVAINMENGAFAELCMKHARTLVK